MFFRTSAMAISAVCFVLVPAIGQDVVPPYTPPSGPTITIKTPQGDVVIRNIYKSGKISADQQTVIVAEKAGVYQDVFNVIDSSFIITVLKMPFDPSRMAGEGALLKALGISRQNACKLFLSEGVPVFVSGSQRYTGRIFPLSFCARR